ncbi:MAG: hypothetical protein KJ804_12310, partial [Proteobacteria bacterium]|nr:hypothetical protein [Pseudomonadota bacterium]
RPNPTVQPQNRHLLSPPGIALQGGAPLAERPCKAIPGGLCRLFVLGLYCWVARVVLAGEILDHAPQAKDTPARNACPNLTYRAGA